MNLLSLLVYYFSYHNLNVSYNASEEAAKQPRDGFSLRFR